MNRFILVLGLSLTTTLAWAQQGPPARGVCFSSFQMSPWIQVDAETAIVEVNRKTYLVTVPDCDSFFTGLNSEVVGSNGSRICEGAEIRYSNGGQYVESCFVEDIVRYQINPQTNAVEINEIED